VRFIETGLPGAFLIEVEPQCDERGLFARTFCADEFAAKGLASSFVQCSSSYNEAAGTLRGMHWQDPPHAEVKLVRCTAGAIFDAIVDLRPGSPTRGRWFSAELAAETRRMLYVPEGFAHGFQALRAGSEVFYQMSRPFAPRVSRGFRFDDPAVGIRWPLPPGAMSPRDRELPRLREEDLDG
jgi:dTDP-4-dehydrorhamnose 3,5-epimerase